MKEIPRHAKFLAERRKTAKDQKLITPDIEKLKKQALRELFAEYGKLEVEIHELVKKDPVKTNKLVDQGNELLDRIEALAGQKTPLIDELEDILGIGKKKESAGIQEITATTPEGKEVKLELKEQLEQWRKFYQEKGVDWCELPEDIQVTQEQATEMKRLIEELGFDHLIIIPENLADTGEKYEKLNQVMSEGYNDTWQSGDFKADGGFEGLKNTSNGLPLTTMSPAPVLK